MTLKKFIFGTLALLTLTVFSGFQAEDACDSKALKDKAKKGLDPFKYDSSKLIKVALRKESFMKEMEVPLFLGESYRFLFNTEALGKNVEISIYNKEKDSRNRKLLFSTKDAPADKKEHVFELNRSMKVYVDFTIPAGEVGASAGCIVFMLGYK